MPSYVHITYQTNAVKVTERMIPCIGACHAAYKATNAQIYLWCVSYGTKLMSEKQVKINCRSAMWVTNDRTFNILQCSSATSHVMCLRIETYTAQQYKMARKTGST